MLNNLLDFLAVSIQIIGTIFLFFSSPENKPNISIVYSDYNIKEPKKRNKKMQIGFLILCIGLIVQAVSIGLKLFAK